MALDAFGVEAAGLGEPRLFERYDPALGVACVVALRLAFSGLSRGQQIAVNPATALDRALAGLTADLAERLKNLTLSTRGPVVVRIESPRWLGDKPADAIGDTLAAKLKSALGTKHRGFTFADHQEADVEITGSITPEGKSCLLSLEMRGFEGGYTIPLRQIAFNPAALGVKACRTELYTCIDKHTLPARFHAAAHELVKSIGGPGKELARAMTPLRNLDAMVEAAASLACASHRPEVFDQWMACMPDVGDLGGAGGSRTSAEVLWSTRQVVRRVQECTMAVVTGDLAPAVVSAAAPQLARPVIVGAVLAGRIECPQSDGGAGDCRSRAADSLQVVVEAPANRWVYLYEIRKDDSAALIFPQGHQAHIMSVGGQTRLPTSGGWFEVSPEVVAMKLVVSSTALQRPVTHTSDLGSMPAVVQVQELVLPSRVME